MVAKLVSLSVLACLCSVILTQGSTITKPTCSILSGQTGYNPFLKWAKDNGGGSNIVNAQAPTTANKSKWTVCKTVWSNQKGSCCDVNAVKALFKNVVNKAKNRWGRLVRGVAKMRRATNKLRVLLTNMDSNTKSTFKTQQSEDSVGLPPQEALDKIAEFVKNFKGNVDNFKRNGNTCFKALHSFRGYGICHACSGNGGEFASEVSTSTYTGFSIAIKSGTCSKIIEKCHSTWQFILNIQQAAYISALVSRIRKGSTSANKPKIGGRRTLHDAFGSLESCKSTTSSSCTAIVKDKLCESFFSFIDGEATADDNNIDNVPEKAAPKSNGRRLQGSTSTKTDISGSISTSSSGIDLNQVNSELTSSDGVNLNGVEEEKKISALLKASLGIFLLALGLYL